MVSVLASSVVDHGFELQSGQTKDYKISICCFSAKNAALRRKSKFYEKSSLAVFLSFVYLSSTLWGTPTAKVHDPVPWSATIKCHAKR